MFFGLIFGLLEFRNGDGALGDGSAVDDGADADGVVLARVQPGEHRLLLGDAAARQGLQLGIAILQYSKKNCFIKS